MTGTDKIELPLLAYLDHNVLNDLVKDNLFHITERLTRASLTPAYSSETLVEIRRSAGHEHEFLEILERIGALYIVPLLDKNWRLTGEARSRSISPFEAYEEQIENSLPISDLGFGLTGMLQKLYGGHIDKSFEEIFSCGTNELKQLLEQAYAALDDSPEIDEDLRSNLRVLVATLPQLIKSQYKTIAGQLDSKAAGEADVKALDGRFDLGPRVLNNIQGPNVLMKIWEVVKKSVPEAEGKFEAMFGIGPECLHDGSTREKTLPEKVNVIYHQLNYFGYHRDSQLHKEPRFVASFSDMTHAGMASYCDVLMSADVNMVMKTRAAYEYLGAKTHIVLFK